MEEEKLLTWEGKRHGRTHGLEQIGGLVEEGHPCFSVDVLHVAVDYLHLGDPSVEVEDF